MALDPDVKALASEGRNFAALTTIRRDGHPSTHVMWIDADDEHVLVNTEVHRAKYKRVQADPRVTVTIWRAENPYSYVEARGRVVGEVRGPEAKTHIDALGKKYRGTETYTGHITSERVILKIAVDGVFKREL